jgi:hypothetical protein
MNDQKTLDINVHIAAAGGAMDLVHAERSTSHKSPNNPKEHTIDNASFHQ